jgi:hypothetical protein
VPGTNAATANARMYGDYGVWEVVGDANMIESWFFVHMDPLEFFE